MVRSEICYDFNTNNIVNCIWNVWYPSVKKINIDDIFKNIVYIWFFIKFIRNIIYKYNTSERSSKLILFLGLYTFAFVQLYCMFLFPYENLLQLIFHSILIDLVLYI